jgi:hypothetical protein
VEVLRVELEVVVSYCSGVSRSVVYAGVDVISRGEMLGRSWRWCVGVMVSDWVNVWPVSGITNTVYGGNKPRTPITLSMVTT